MNVRFLPVVCAIALFPVTAAAQTGAVSGKVTRSDTAAPIIGVVVQVTNGTTTTPATTDGGGQYSVSGLAPGTYFAYSDVEHGFVNEVYDNVPCPGACSSFTAIDVGAAITVTAGATATGNDFVLLPSGSIRGRVTEAGGLPLQSIYVSIFSSEGAFVATAPTNVLGDYVVDTGLSTGTYYASTSNNGGYVDEIYDNIVCASDCQGQTAGAPIAVVAPSATAGVNFGLVKGGTVAGTITDAGTGLPIGGVRVYLDELTHGTSTIGNTNSQGTYLVTGVPPGTYVVSTFNEKGYLDELFDNVPCAGPCSLEGATPFAVAAGQDVTGKNFALARGGRISGTVVAAGTGTPIHAEVIIYSAAGVRITSGGTDTTGAYISQTGLPPGTYYVATLNFDGYIDQIYDGLPCKRRCQAIDAVALGTPIVVTGATTVTGRNFVLHRGGTIAGRVTNEATGAALRNMQVRAYGPGQAFGSATTDIDGNYAIEALPPAAYVVLTADAFGKGYIPEIYDNIPCVVSCDEGNALPTGTPVNAALDTTTSGIDFRLSQGGSLRGTVIDAGTGAALAGVAVHVASATTNTLTSAQADVTRANGVFTITGLPPGPYYVFTVNGAGYIDEAFGGVPCLGACPDVAVLGTPVTIAGGAQTTGVDFALDAGGRIAGIVSDAGTAAPIDSVSVRIVDAGGRQVQSAQTDVNGTYLTKSGLAAGTYYVSVVGDAGYVSQAYGGTPCLNQCSPASTVALGAPIAVAAGATTSGRNVALVRGGRISGTVTEAGSSVVVGGGRTHFYDAQGRLVMSADVQPAGTYLGREGLPAGSYFGLTDSTTHVNKLYDDIACPAGCDTSRVATGTPIVVTDGVTTTGRNFALAPRTGVPGAPARVTFSPDPQGVLIGWEAPRTGGVAATYRIEAGVTPGSTLASFTSEEPSFLLSGAPAGRFVVRVRAINASGTGPASADLPLVLGAGGVLPDAPVRARAWMAGSRLVMAWDDPYSGGLPTHYLVEAGTAAGLANIATIPAAGRAFTYDPVPAGFYFLRVRAANATGASASSNEVMIVAGGAGSPPAAPVNPGAVANGSTVTLTWTAPAGTVDGYVVEAGSAPGLSNLAVLPIGAITQLVVANVAPGTYYVRLRGVNAFGRGVVSEEMVIVVG